MVLSNGLLWSAWAQTAESGQCSFQGFGKTPVNWQVVSLVSTLVPFHDWETGCYRCEVVLHCCVFMRCGCPRCSELEMLRGFLSLYLPMRLLHVWAPACIDLPHWVTLTHTRAPRFPDGTHPHRSVVIPERAGWVSETVPVGITVTSVFCHS